MTLRNWKWSAEKPSKLGHYWFRREERHTPEIVELYVDEEWNRTHVKWGPYSEHTDFLENYNGQWCGPIPEPSES